MAAERGGGPDLRLAGVGKTYGDGTVAVAGFDLDVAAGEFVSFLGPSGCGKTTTLRMVAGFEAATTGDILIRGRRVNDTPPERRPTGMIFQNYALFPHLTVRRNVGYGLEVRGVPAVERARRVAAMLGRLGLEDVADARPDRLSGGQRQRAALARALVVGPEILLLDEPLGALDANLRRSVQAELRLLQRNLGVTSVFVTHAQSEALALSDRVVVMNRGQVEQVGTPVEVYTRPASLFVARFIGRNAILDGAVAGRAEDGALVLDTPFGRMRGRAASPAAGASAEGGAKLAVPAEEIALLAPGAAVPRGWNAAPGVVDGMDRLGHLVQVRLRLGGTQAVTIEAHADSEAAGVAAPGDAVVAAWPPEATTVVPAEAA